MAKQEDLAEFIIWLETREATNRESRIRRISHLLEAIQWPEGGFFFQGIDSRRVYDEVRLAYIQGLYLATVLLSLSFIEREIAGRLYAAGWEEAGEANFKNLLSKAQADHMISDWDQETLIRLSDIRNAYSHFRPPDPKARSAKRHKIPSLMDRAVAENLMPHEVSQKDAEYAIEILGRFIARRMSLF